MDAYIEQLDKVSSLCNGGWSLQTRISNSLSVWPVNRKGAVRVFRDLEIIGVVVATLVFVDLLLIRSISATCT